MKKVWVISGIVLGIVAISFVGICALVDDWLPKADAIVCPNDEHVLSIVLTANDAVVIEMDDEQYNVVLECIRNAKPTRRMSVNDVPSTNTYYILNVTTATKNYRYFVYEDGSRVYIEMPYQGIYKADRQFFDLITTCFS